MYGGSPGGNVSVRGESPKKHTGRNIHEQESARGSRRRGLAAGGYVYVNTTKVEKVEGEKGLSMQINKAAKEIVMPAEVNGKYFTEPTRHGVVFVSGSNGQKSVLRGLSNEKEFHDALLAMERRRATT
jgi:hypothetical protein